MAVAALAAVGLEVERNRTNPLLLVANKAGNEALRNPDLRASLSDALATKPLSALVSASAYQGIAGTVGGE